MPARRLLSITSLLPVFAFAVPTAAATEVAQVSEGFELVGHDSLFNRG
jgi:hypothetical protein